MKMEYQRNHNRTISLVDGRGYHTRGPFDVRATPMETEDSTLITASMLGCPYRMTSYTGKAMVDADTRYGSTASSSTVSGVHRSSGVGKTFKSVSIVLGGQVRPRKCYGGGCKPTARRGGS